LNRWNRKRIWIGTVLTALVLGFALPIAFRPARIYGAILPHHQLPKAQIESFFHFIGSQDPEVVVVVGPNHYNRGKGALLTSAKGLGAKTETLAKNLTASGLVEVDDLPFRDEFSVSNLIPHIKKTFPRASILPILLKSPTTQDDAERLGILLSKILPKNSLVLASVDFSHYQLEPVAEFHDLTSLATLRDFDFETIYKLEVDSPASLMATLSYLRAKGAQKLLYSARTSSAILTGNLKFSEGNTSHQYLAFGKGEPKKQMGISLLFFGDAHFDRGVLKAAKNLKPGELLTDIEGVEGRFFMGNHFNTLNLEGPIAATGEPRKKLVVFNQDKSLTLGTLKKGRFNWIGLANNHMLDYCESGAEGTAKTLESNRIGSYGYPDPCAFKTVQGFALALCGFVDDGSRPHTEMAEAVKEATTKADKTIVTLHWGIEDSEEATRSQTELAHQLIDAGADAILGHHPHVIQPFEIYKNRPIVYSLGNFIFDQPGAKNRLGLGVGLFLERTKTTAYLFPFESDRIKPRPLDYSERQDFFSKYLEGLKKESILDEKIILGPLQ